MTDVFAEKREKPRVRVAFPTRGGLVEPVTALVALNNTTSRVLPIFSNFSAGIFGSDISGVIFAMF